MRRMYQAVNTSGGKTQRTRPWLDQRLCTERGPVRVEMRLIVEGIGNQLVLRPGLSQVDKAVRA